MGPVTIKYHKRTLKIIYGIYEYFLVRNLNTCDSQLTSPQGCSTLIT